MLGLIALHKHWCTADAVKQFVSARLPVEPTTLNKPLEDCGQQQSMFFRLSVWYSLIYVVVEGYRDLGLKDEKIEALLSDSVKVESLRRFRNAVFHFQEDPIGPKLMEFLETEESETWVRELNVAFKAFFERKLPVQMFLEAIRSQA